MSLSFVREQWAEGARHGFPGCCRARWILDRLRPSLTRALLPGRVGDRVYPLVHPRYAVADGMVPCEYHLARFLLDGDRSGWRAPLPAEWCCDQRRELVLGGHARLVCETFRADEMASPAEDGDEAPAVVSDEVVTVWMFGHGDDAISVSCCPWCGEALP